MVHTRPLRGSDKADILEIARNTWEGQDYLPCMFEEWLKNENCHTLVIEENGHIAALANLKIIEGGITGWMEGLRVHPKFRGKGYASILTNRLVDMAKELGVQRLRYTTATENEASLHLASKIGMVRVFDLGGYWDANLSRIEWETSTEKIVSVNVMNEHNLILDSKLIPSNVLVLDWKAFDATLEGFMGLTDVEVWAHKNNDILESLSISAIRHDMHGPLWGFTIYTKQEQHFLEQFSFHLNRAREKGTNRIMMTYPPDFYDLLYRFDWVNPNHSEIGIVLLEKIL